MPVNIQLSKIVRRACPAPTKLVVGLGRIELPTSPLSGVRSSQLSYRPGHSKANWWSWSGSNRRPPECKSGALPAELQPLIRRPQDKLATRNKLSRPIGCCRPAPGRSGKVVRRTLSGDPGTDLDWKGYYLLTACSCSRLGFSPIR